jgi:hypothetical protein
MKSDKCLKRMQPDELIRGKENMRNYNSCYGNMFPDLLRLGANVPLLGHVMSVKVTRLGIGVHDREVELHRDEWEKCIQCDDYRTCYDLSVAKVSVRAALRNAF